jgi:TolB-like protein
MKVLPFASFLFVSSVLVFTNTSFAQSDIQESVPANTAVQAADGVQPQAIEIRESAKSESHIYRKKIVATAFVVNQPALSQVQDIDDIAQGIPTEIIHRLEQLGDFLGRRSTNLLSYSGGDEAPSFKLVRQVANEFDGQFVLTGAVLHAGNSREDKYLGLWHKDTRYIEIELALYDAISGALIDKRRVFGETADVSPVGRGKRFGSASFLRTGFGQAMNSVLREAVQFVSETLEPMPMMARILKIHDGEVTFDAGSTSLVAIGDNADAIGFNNELPAKSLTSSQAVLQQFGVPHGKVAAVNAIQVFPTFTVAKLDDDTKQADISVGDFVRFVKPSGSTQ